MPNWFHCSNCGNIYDGDLSPAPQMECVCGHALTIPPRVQHIPPPILQAPQQLTQAQGGSQSVAPQVHDRASRPPRRRFTYGYAVALLMAIGLVVAAYIIMPPVANQQRHVAALDDRAENEVTLNGALGTNGSPIEQKLDMPNPEAVAPSAPTATIEIDLAANADLKEITASQDAVEIKNTPSVIDRTNGASATPTAAISESPSFHTVLTPFVQTYCVNCHGSEKQESALRLDDLAAVPTDTESLEVWTEILNRLNVHEMPPKGSPQPTDQTMMNVIAWLDQSVRQAEKDLAAGAGRAVMRRLNRNEYTNTIRELTAVGFQADERFPEDEVADGFDNIGRELIVSPTLMEKYVRAAQTIVRQVLARPGSTSFQRVLGDTDPKQSGKTDARRVLRVFASRSFRRPVSPEKLDRLYDLFLTSFDAGKSFKTSMRIPLQAILCSPQFIYMLESSGKLDDYALATRLSYFLWSSMPDDSLLRLAHKGRLREPSVLREQVDRMLNDPRASEFTHHFAGQWLGLREIGIMQPDKTLFPQYNDSLAESMRQETELFFSDILQRNLSILNFIDSDFTMLNSDLARLYGIDSVSGTNFRRVAIRPDQHRGGVLTHASVLSMTGDGVDSSPVMRGVWILERLLGTPPSPPPPNVPDFEPDTRGTKTIRDELSRHRTIESCNTCHHKIDPLGFALENYDAIGQWRDQYRATTPSNKKKKAVSQPGQAVDPSGQWPDGSRFETVDQFKSHLLQRKEQFAECLIKKLLTYACGRSMGVVDEDEIKRIAQDAASNEYRFKSLIHQITQSVAFQTK